MTTTNKKRAKKKVGGGGSKRTAASAPPTVTKRKKTIVSDVLLSEEDTMLLSAIDTYHDFGDTSRTANISLKDLVKNILGSFIKNTEVEQKLATYTSNFNKMKDIVYSEYISTNTNIKSVPNIKINTGLNDKAGHGITLPIRNKIFKEFFIDDDKDIGIVSDLSSLVGCREELKYIASYATWFDSNDDCDKNFKIVNQLSIDKQNKELFYIDTIEGALSNSGKATGKIYWPNLPLSTSFSENTEDNIRPEVTKYAAYIDVKKLDTTSDFDIQFRNFNTKQMKPHQKMMFLMDLKRAGDGLQIISAKGLQAFGTSKTFVVPIFITSDIIAASIAANKGVRTILTQKDHLRFGNNPHALKYATFLMHNTLLSPTLLKSLEDAALAKYAQDLEKKGASIINDVKVIYTAYNSEVEKNLKTLIDSYGSPTTINKQNPRTTIYSGASETFKKKYETYMTQKEDGIKEYVGLLDKEKKFLENTKEIIANKEIDAHIANRIYSTIIEQIKKEPEFTEDTKNKIKEAFTKYTTKILEYATNCNCIHTMSYYLRYIVDLVNRYLYEEKYIPLILHLHQHVFNIYTEVLNTIRPPYQFEKDLIIVYNYVQPIFKYDEEQYTSIISVPYHLLPVNDTNGIRSVICSVVGTLYMDYLITNVETSSQSEKLMETIKTVITGDNSQYIQERLITNTTSRDTFTNPTLVDFYKDVSNKKKVKELYNVFFKRHEAYMYPFHHICPSKKQNSRCTIMGGSSISPLRHSSSLKIYTEMPFIQKLQHVKANPSFLKKIYLKYYLNSTHKKSDLLKNLEFTQKRNAIHIPDYVFKTDDDIGFQIFKESLYLSPQLIDPVTTIYMVYSNKLLYPDIELYNAAMSIKIVQKPGPRRQIF
jgi:hypothetical protein